MKMKHLDFMIPNNLADKIEQVAAQQKKSKTELAIEYLAHGLECRKLETGDQRLKYIQLGFPGTCKKCGAKVEAGEWAFWGGRGSGLIICCDCEVRKFGTKTQAQMALKIDEAEYTLHALKKEIGDNVEKYKGKNWIDILTQIQNELTKIRELNEKFLVEGDKLPENERIVEEEVKKVCKETLDLVQEAREFMMNPYKKRKKKLEAAVEYEPEQT